MGIASGPPMSIGFSGSNWQSARDSRVRAAARFLVMGFGFIDYYLLLLKTRKGTFRKGTDHVSRGK
jgi:hypothetical protein